MKKILSNPFFLIFCFLLGSFFLLVVIVKFGPVIFDHLFQYKITSVIVSIAIMVIPFLIKRQFRIEGWQILEEDHNFKILHKRRAKIYEFPFGIKGLFYDVFCITAELNHSKKKVSGWVAFNRTREVIDISWKVSDN